MTGTAATRIGGVQAANEAHATTPEAPELQLALRAMAVAGDRAAVVETTSHGLALGRVDGIAYDAAVFTNLTHEHLELHGTWEAYRDAKLSLFERLAPHVAEASRLAGRRDRQRGRPVGRRVRRRRPGGGRPHPHLRHGPGGGRPRHARRGGRQPPPVRLRRPVGERHDRPPARRPLQRPQRAGRRGARGGDRARSGGRPGRSGGGAGRAGPDGAGGGRPAVRRHRRLRAQPGLAPGRARPARPARGVAWRRADRRLRLGGRARHCQAAADGADRGRACTDRGRHRRGPARRGPPGHPRRDRDWRRGGRQARATTTCSSSPIGAPRSTPPSSAPDRATSSCWPGRVTSRPSSARRVRCHGTSARRRRPPCNEPVTRRPSSCEAVSEC